ncbi:MAG: YbhB/YbcL family Raf kinase inhibitor-like protein [Clostridia bacterium]|nr:YbhB/YbcL family Raf kinase inhibitor-like protein [Clostridia bacterium]
MEQLKFNLPDFTNGDKFPLDYTGRGKDLSPEILIENLSENAKTLAVTLEDISHPIKNFTHWVIWNIPAASKIEKAVPKGKSVLEAGTVQGAAYGMHRYAGPKPPHGKTHKYRITVYSLDCSLELSASKRKKHLLKKAENHILQKGSLEYSFE